MLLDQVKSSLDTVHGLASSSGKFYVLFGGQAQDLIVPLGEAVFDGKLHGEAAIGLQSHVASSRNLPLLPGQPDQWPGFVQK